MLPPDLAREAERWQRVTRDPVRPRTCPLAAGREPSAWLDELSEVYAVMRACKGAMGFRELAGRDPHRWDVAAMRLTTSVEAAVARSDEAIRKREKAEKDAREGKG